MTFRELMQYVRAGGRPVQIRFAIVMAALAICAATCAAAIAAVVFAVIR